MKANRERYVEKIYSWKVRSLNLSRISSVYFVVLTIFVQSKITLNQSTTTINLCSQQGANVPSKIFLLYFLKRGTTPPVSASSDAYGPPLHLYASFGHLSYYHCTVCVETKSSKSIDINSQRVNDGVCAGIRRTIEAERGAYVTYYVQPVPGANYTATELKSEAYAHRSPTTEFKHAGCFHNSMQASVIALFWQLSCTVRRISRRRLLSTEMGDVDESIDGQLIARFSRAIIPSFSWTRSAPHVIIS